MCYFGLIYCKDIGVVAVYRLFFVLLFFISAVEEGKLFLSEASYKRNGFYSITIIVQCDACPFFVLIMIIFAFRMQPYLNPMQITVFEGERLLHSNC